MPPTFLFNSSFWMASHDENQARNGMDRYGVPQKGYK